MDKLEDKADIGETASSKVALAQLMETLSQREKELIRMRYYDDYTQMQVAKEFGISQVQVSRMEKKILWHAQAAVCVIGFIRYMAVPPLCPSMAYALRISSSSGSKCRHLYSLLRCG